MNYDEFRARIREEKLTSTYDELVARYGVNRYWLWHIVKDDDDDFEPPASVAAALGITIFRLAPACEKCGEVHTLGYCASGYSGEYGPAPLCPKCKKVHVKKTCDAASHAPPRPRASINLLDPKSAARTIKARMSAEAVHELARLLAKEDSL
jgi:hypothetical protein